MIPKNDGWYWTKSGRTDGWALVFISQFEKAAHVFDGANGPIGFQDRMSFEDVEKLNWSWYGPFECPGGPNAMETVVFDEAMHQEAMVEREAMVVLHVDYRYCDVEKDPITLKEVTDSRTAGRKYYRVLQDPPPPCMFPDPSLPVEGVVN